MKWKIHWYLKVSSAMIKDRVTNRLVLARKNLKLDIMCALDCEPAQYSSNLSILYRNLSMSALLCNPFGVQWTQYVVYCWLKLSVWRLENKNFGINDYCKTARKMSVKRFISIISTLLVRICWRTWSTNWSHLGSLGVLSKQSTATQKLYGNVCIADDNKIFIKI